MQHSTDEATINLKLRLTGLATTVAVCVLPAADALASGRSWC
jgi:hypothetical protein